MSQDLVTVETHLEDVMAAVGALPTLELGIGEAHGCVLAEEVVAGSDLPGFDNSAMDGYAVRSDDVAAASADRPVRLPVVADVAAGNSGSYTVQSGLCVRIMTGAPMPSGADAVVPVELTDAGTQTVQIFSGVAAGSHVRRAGEDVRAGELLLKAGTALQAAQLALVAATGRPRVRVHPRPRVVVISTGSELVEPGAPTRPGQIYDSNSYLLTAAARETGAVAYRVGIVPDDPHTLIDAIEDQLVRADLIVTSGGVSAGAYDIVKQVMPQLGQVEFRRVAMQPGMPQAFGLIGADGIPFFGLPGNPVSALVSFEVFVRPAIRAMLGVVPLQRPRVRARLRGGVRASVGRRQFLRGWLEVEQGEYVVSPVGGSGSHLLAALSRSNALIVVPEEVGDVPDGSSVQVMVLERRQML